MYLHVVGCSLWEAKLLVVFWKRLKTQYCFVLLKESLRHHSPHNCMFFFSYTIWQKIFVESVHILLNLLIRHCCAVLFIQLKNYINNLFTYMWLWKCPSIYGVLGKLKNILAMAPLCFQQEYLRLPKNLLLTLHDLTKKWPKMTSNDLKSKNYRTKTPTKI